MTQGRTFDDAFQQARGSATGFDYLRLGLALYVFLWHCLSIPDPDTGKFIWAGGFGPFHRSILPMFFALSGFLVAGSFARNDVVKFVALRGLRILPALAVEITLVAVVIGPAFTTLPLGDYLQSREFWTYFLNIIGDIHYTLPGVFDGMRINTQLWTIPIEFQCYSSLVILAVCGLSQRRDIILLITITTCCAMTYVAMKHNLVNNGPAVPHLVLTLSFLCGFCANLFKEKIPLRLDIFIGCALAGYAFLFFNNLVFLSSLPLTYITVFLGLANPVRIKFGDLSYGIYLFHSPILCCLFNVSGRSGPWWFLLACGLPLTLAFAFLSWTFVENPILKRKASLLATIDFAAGKVARLLPLSIASHLARVRPLR